MDFLPYFNEHVTKIKLVEKPKSWFMKLINFGLSITNWLKVTDIKNFLTSYGTTIGNVIYDSPKWPWDKKPSPHMVHELTHVIQWGAGYMLSYLFSPMKRAFYESVCIQSEWLIFPETGTERNVMVRADRLIGYGIEYAAATRMLEDRLEEVREGFPQEESKRMKEAYEAWKSGQ